MISATLFQAKTNLSELVRRARKGERVVITSGREKTPVVTLTPVEPAPRQRLGLLADSGFALPANFFDSLPEDELRLWEGDPERSSCWTLAPC